MARYNLIPNPSWETNTALWSVDPVGGGSISDYSRTSSSSPAAGSWQSRIQRSTDGGFSLSAPPMPVTGGLSYAWSIYARAEGSTSCYVYITWQNSSGGAVGDTLAGTQGVPANATTRIYSIGVAPATATQAVAFLWFPSVQALNRIYLDGALFEQSASVGTYFDGSFPDCGWVGTAHGSASVTPVNAAPTANAGSDQEVNVGDVVHLDGTGSSDPDPGDSLTYSWTVVDDGGTGLTTGDLTGANTATSSFVAPGFDAKWTEGFESGSPFNAGATGYALDSTNPHSGTQSYKSNGVATYSTRYDDTRMFSASADFQYSGWLRVPAGTNMAGLAIGVTGSGNTGYQLMLDGRQTDTASQSSFQLRQNGTGTLAYSGNLSLAANTWYRVEFEWRATGSERLVGRLYDATDTLIHTLTSTNASYTSGYVGVFGYDTGHFDDLTLTTGDTRQITLELEVEDGGGLTDVDTVTITVEDSAATYDIAGTGGVAVSGAAAVTYLQPYEIVGGGGVTLSSSAFVEDLTFTILADITMSGGVIVGGHAEQSQFTYEVHEQPPPVARPIRYEAVLVARVPQASGPPALVLVDRLVVDGLSYTHELNRAGSAQLGCPVRSLSPAVKDRFVNMAQFPCEVWIYRDQTLAWAGDLQSLQVQGQTLTINCAGLLGYTRRMGVVADEVFTNTDQFTIAARLVDQWQELPYGHYGIDTSQVTTSGVVRDRTYLRDELHNVAERLEDLTEVIDGFDMHVDPGTRALTLSYPARGQDLTATVFFDDRNIDSADVVLSVGVDDLVTDTSATSSFFTEGAGQQLLHTARENPPLRATFGRTWAETAHHDISEQATLEGHADAYLAARNGVFFQPGVSVIPRPGGDVGEFEPGDWVSYSYDAGIGRQSGIYRVAKVTVTVDASGAERLGVEFV